MTPSFIFIGLVLFILLPSFSYSANWNNFNIKTILSDKVPADFNFRSPFNNSMAYYRLTFTPRTPTPNVDILSILINTPWNNNATVEKISTTQTQTLPFSVSYDEKYLRFAVHNQTRPEFNISISIIDKVAIEYNVSIDFTFIDTSISHNAIVGENWQHYFTWPNKPIYYTFSLSSESFPFLFPDMKNQSFNMTLKLSYLDVDYFERIIIANNFTDNITHHFFVNQTFETFTLTTLGFADWYIVFIPKPANYTPRPFQFIANVTPDYYGWCEDGWCQPNSKPGYVAPTQPAKLGFPWWVFLICIGGVIIVGFVWFLTLNRKTKTIYTE